MQEARPKKLADPVCGMTVDVDGAEAAGLLLEHDGRTWAFCGRGCRRLFVESPGVYITAAEAALAVATVPKGLPVIDDGMRRWYESCSCCLSEAYPDIKAQLDAERAAARASIPEGICEVAEAAAPVV